MLLKNYIDIKFLKIKKSLNKEMILMHISTYLTLVILNNFYFILFKKIICMVTRI